MLALSPNGVVSIITLCSERSEMLVITNCHEVRLVMRLQLEKFIITRAVGFDLVAALLLRALYLFCQNERLLGVFFCSHL